MALARTVTNLFLERNILASSLSIMYADREWISVCMHIHVIHEFMGKWTMELDVT